MEDLRQLGVSAKEAAGTADRILAEHPGETDPHALVGAYFRQKSVERISERPPAKTESPTPPGKGPLDLTPTETAHRATVEALRSRNARLKEIEDGIAFARGVPDLEKVAELETERAQLVKAMPPAQRRELLGVGTLQLTGKAPSATEPSTLPPPKPRKPPTGEWPAEETFERRPSAPPLGRPEPPVILPEDIAALLGIKRKRPKAFEPSAEGSLVSEAAALAPGLDATYLRQAALELADQIMTGGGANPRKQGIAATLSQQLRRYALTGLEAGERGGQGLHRPWLRDKLIEKAKEIYDVESTADAALRRAKAMDRLRRMRDRKERQAFESFVDEVSSEEQKPPPPGTELRQPTPQRTEEMRD